MQTLTIDRDIQVRTGDFRREWKDAKITNVTMEDVDEDENGNTVKGLSFTVKFNDNCIQRVSDAFGWAAGEWRYKEKCCEQCKWHSIEGGDTVPYGSTTATLPEEMVCNCSEMDEEIDIPYDETNGGKECDYFIQDGAHYQAGQQEG